MLARPAKSEYSSDYESSISKVPDGNVLEILEVQIEETVALLLGLDEKKGSTSYTPGKWTIKQVVGHLIDSERIFGYRALRFARGDETPLPGYEQDDYVKRGNFDVQSMRVLAEELRAVRMATLALFRSFDDSMWLKKGTASGCEFTVRTIPYQMAGHEIHHMSIIRERYL